MPPPPPFSGSLGPAHLRWACLVCHCIDFRLSADRGDALMSQIDCALPFCDHVLSFPVFLIDIYGTRLTSLLSSRIQIVILTTRAWVFAGPANTCSRKFVLRTNESEFHEHYEPRILDHNIFTCRFLEYPHSTPCQRLWIKVRSQASTSSAAHLCIRISFDSPRHAIFTCTQRRRTQWRLWLWNYLVGMFHKRCPTLVLSIFKRFQFHTRRANKFISTRPQKKHSCLNLGLGWQRRVTRIWVRRSHFRERRQSSDLFWPSSHYLNIVLRYSLQEFLSANKCVR